MLTTTTKMISLRRPFTTRSLTADDQGRKPRARPGPKGRPGLHHFERSAPSQVLTGPTPRPYCRRTQKIAPRAKASVMAVVIMAVSRIPERSAGRPDLASASLQEAVAVHERSTANDNAVVRPTNDDRSTLATNGMISITAAALQRDHGKLAWQEANRRLTGVANRRSDEFRLWSSVAFSLVQTPK